MTISPPLFLRKITTITETEVVTIPRSILFFFMDFANVSDYVVVLFSLFIMKSNKHFVSVEIYFLLLAPHLVSLILVYTAI